MKKTHMRDGDKKERKRIIRAEAMVLNYSEECAGEQEGIL